MASAKKRPKVYPSFIGLDYAFGDPDKENNAVCNRPTDTDEFKRHSAKTNSGLKVQPADTIKNIIEIKLETTATVELKTREKGDASSECGENKEIRAKVNRAILRVKRPHLVRQDTPVLNETIEKPQAEQVSSPKVRRSGDKNILTCSPGNQIVSRIPTPKKDIKIECDDTLESKQETMQRKPEGKVLRKRKGVPDSSENVKDKTKVKSISSPDPNGTQIKLNLTKTATRKTSKRKITEKSSKRKIREEQTAGLPDGEDPKELHTEQHKLNLTKKSSKETTQVKSKDSGLKRKLNSSPKIDPVPDKVQLKAPRDSPKHSLVTEFDKQKRPTRKLTAKKLNSSSFFEIKSSKPETTAAASIVETDFKEEKSKKLFSTDKIRLGKMKTSDVVKKEAHVQANLPKRSEPAVRSSSPGYRGNAAKNTKSKTEDKAKTLNQIRLSCATEQQITIEKQSRGRGVLRKRTAPGSPKGGGPDRPEEPNVSPIEKRDIPERADPIQPRTSRHGAENESELEKSKKTGAIPKKSKMPKNVLLQTPGRMNTSQSRSTSSPEGLHRKVKIEKTGYSGMWETPKRQARKEDCESALTLVIEAIKDQGSQKSCSVQSIKKFIKARRGVDFTSDILRKALEMGLLSNRIQRQGSVQTVSLIGSYRLPVDEENPQLPSSPKVPETKPLSTGQVTTLESPKGAAVVVKSEPKRLFKGKDAPSQAGGVSRPRPLQNTPNKKKPVTRSTSTPMYPSEPLLNTTFVLSPIKEYKTDTEDSPKRSKKVQIQTRRRSRSESVFPRKPKALSAAAAVRARNTNAK